MGYKLLIDYLVSEQQKAQETKVVIYFNGKKCSNQTYLKQTTMKKLLENCNPTDVSSLKTPMFENNKLYSISLYYKEKGIYEPTAIHSTYAFLDPDGQLSFYVTKSDILESVYMKKIGDYCLYGSAKKKIIIHETNLNFYKIDIASANVNNTINICKSTPLSLIKEVTKKLSKYNFTIEDVKYDLKGSIHRIKVSVSTQGTKSIISRLLDSL